jgi:hypothetical protein
MLRADSFLLANTSIRSLLWMAKPKSASTARNTAGVSSILFAVLTVFCSQANAEFIASIPPPATTAYEGMPYGVTWELSERTPGAGTARFWRIDLFDISTTSPGVSAHVATSNHGMPNTSFGIIGFIDDATLSFPNDGPHGITLQIPYEYNEYVNNHWQTHSGVTTSVTRGVEVLNVAPTISATYVNGIPFTSLSIDEGTLLDLSMDAKDPGADPITFTISGAKAGKTLGGPGLTLHSANVSRMYLQEGIQTIRFDVSDDDTTSMVTREIVVNNAAPTITQIPHAGTALLGEYVNLSVLATDPGHDPISYSWDFNGDHDYGDDSGLTVNRVFSQLGPTTVHVRAADNQGAYDDESFVVDVLLGGDFNNDRIVDSADLANWQNNFGTTSEAVLGGRGNSDGVIDGTDFLYWSRNVGLSTILLSRASNVTPEMATRTLLMIAAGLSISYWRNRARNANALS